MWLWRGLPRALPTPAPRLRAAGWACSACRRSSSSADATTPALAIDLEGVVLRGGVVVEGAIETLRPLQELEVPFILLSNGSGNTEKAKASWISQRLGVEITCAAPPAHPNLDGADLTLAAGRREDQIQDANTPMRALAEKHRDDLVIFVGKQGARGLAESYGFNNAITAVRGSPRLLRRSPHLLLLQRVQELVLGRCFLLDACRLFQRCLPHPFCLREPEPSPELPFRFHSRQVKQVPRLQPDWWRVAPSRSQNS